MNMNLTEKIMVDKIKSLEGWSKDIIDNNTIRNICIGNIKNCNDEIIKNDHIKQEFIDFAEKYDISANKYSIKTVSNKYEHSYIMMIDEQEYNRIQKIF